MSLSAFLSGLVKAGAGRPHWRSFFASAGAEGAVEVTGTVGSNGKYLLSGTSLSGPSSAIVNFAFQNLTSGTNLPLCAGSTADFQAGTCATELASSGGPGFTFLSIVDVGSLNGKVWLINRNVGTAAKFAVVAESQRHLGGGWS